MPGPTVIFYLILTSILIITFVVSVIIDTKTDSGLMDFFLNLLSFTLFTIPLALIYNYTDVSLHWRRLA